MPWWAWLIVGVLLVGVELTAADMAFYFIFMGAAAILVGVLQLAGADLPIWGQWLLYAILAVASMVLFRERLYKRLRGNLPGFDAGPTGEVVDVTAAVAQGGQTRIRLRGTQWSARNVGPAEIAAGSQARVISAKGTILEISALEISALGSPLATSASGAEQAPATSPASPPGDAAQKED